MQINGYKVPACEVSAVLANTHFCGGACACCGAAIYGDSYYKSENTGVIFNISQGKNKLPESDAYDVDHVQLDNGLVLNIKLNRVDRRGE